MGCRFCGRPCGGREFCDEVCYEEYTEDMAIFQQSIEEELPVGGRDYFDEPPQWDVVGGL